MSGRFAGYATGRLALALGLLAVLLTACSSLSVPPTPYKPAPAGGGSGYSEVWLDERRASVRFAGNWKTDRQTVEQGLLYRAAELAAQRNAPRFAVRDRLVEREVTETIETPPFPSWWYRDRYRWPGFYGGYGGYGAFGPRVRIWTTYTGTMEIEILPPGAEGPPNAILHETDEVLRRLAPQVLPGSASQTGAVR